MLLSWGTHIQLIVTCTDPHEMRKSRDSQKRPPIRLASGRLLSNWAWDGDNAMMSSWYGVKWMVVMECN